MTTLGLLMLEVLIFGLVSAGLWWALGKWWPSGGLRQIPARPMSLPTQGLRLALLLGFLATAVFLLACRFMVAGIAKRFFYSENHNVVSRVLTEDMGYKLEPNKVNWLELARNLAGNKEADTSYSIDPKADKKLGTRFRNAFCRDRNRDEILHPDLAELFTAIASKPRAPDGFAAAIGVISNGLKENGARLEGYADLSEYPKLADYLGDQYLIPILGWSPSRPDARKILKGMGTPYGHKQGTQVGNLDPLQNTLDQSFNNGKLGPAQEAVLLAHLDRMTEAMDPFYRALELIFGVIQLLTFVMFFTGLALLRFRHLLLVDQQNFDADGTPAQTQFLAQELALTLKNDSELNAKPKLALAKSKLKTAIQWVEEGIDKTEYAVIDYIVWGMPSLGFVGTVLGIGAALSDADQVVRAVDAASQAHAISGVTSLLGVAFDTTLIALICGLPTMALVTWIRSSESRFLEHLIERMEQLGLLDRYRSTKAT